MEVTSSAASRASVRPTRVAIDFLLLAAAAVVAGLLAAAAAGAVVILLSAPSYAAEVAPDEVPLEAARSGSLMLKTASGLYRALPTLKTDVRIRATGIVARAQVSQAFQNPTDGWIEAVYVFPLPENAAVDHLRVRAGERVIEGRIREREAARKTYEQAKREGRRTTLLEQERPNMFTNNVANIGPGETVVVELEYQQTLRYDQGAFRLRFPMVVGPRYIPGTPVERSSATGRVADTDKVPDASRMTPPVLPRGRGPVNSATIRVEIDAGFPLARLDSVHHPVVIERIDGKQVVTLKEGAVVANRDFELVWAPQRGQAPAASVFTEVHDGETYALVMLMPPHETAAAGSRIAREAIFVIDTSGSMSGSSIEQAREALLLALDRLTPADRFNVIQFNSRTDVLFRTARAADAQALAEARGYVRGLKAQGGTEMADALRAALDGSRSSERLRQVIFLTDGAVGNEDELFRIIDRKRGDSRLFTVGIGSAPNAHFMTKAAQFGQGTFTYVGNVAEVKQKMSELFAKLENPVLSRIEVHWPQNAKVEMWPPRIPDLYSGEPVLLSARLADLHGELTVTGTRASGDWRTSLPLKATAQESGMGVLWARHKIAALMDDMRTGGNSDTLRAQVVSVALEHHLVSKYTSLVAVDVTPARPAAAALDTAAVPTQLPEGWDYAMSVGELPQTATPQALHLLLAAIGLMLAGACWASGRRFAVTSRARC